MDASIDSDCTIMLIYNLPEAQRIYRCISGVNGLTYLVGGRFTVMNNNNVAVLPARAGIVS